MLTMKGRPAICALGLAICLAGPGASAYAQAEGRSTEAHAQTVLEEAQELLTDPPHKPTRELTLVLTELAQVSGALEGPERREAREILARPTDSPNPDDPFVSYSEPEADPLCTSHFCVHYVTGTPDAPPLADGQPNGVPDYVEAVAAALEDSYEIENGTLGWEPPLSDASVDGDARTDAYLARLGSGLYGYAAPDPGQDFQYQQHGYLVLDDDYASFVTPELSAVEAMQVTAAHEYNHVLQFAYDTGYEDWAKESAATWVEEKVFPSVNDYVHFLDDLAGSPETPLTSGAYEFAAFNHWLEARAGTPDVIRDAWEATLAPNQTEPPHFALSGYDEAVGGTGESPFEEISEVEFAEFAAATPEWRASDAFPDAASYPDVERAAVLRVGGRAHRLLLDHLSFALFTVKNAGSDAVKLKARIEEGAAGAFALVGRTGDPVSGSVTSVDGDLHGPGRATVTLPNPGGLERLTAVLVNADARITSGQSPGFHADDVAFRARVVRAG